jgi:hypothetical protein
MIRLRRASAIAVLCVLASAATACADCAWVLWSNDHAKQWVLRGTHRDKQACFRQIEKEFDDHPATYRERADGNMLAKGSVSTYTFHCLPDTVDPRGPKAGPK